MSLHTTEATITNAFTRANNGDIDFSTSAIDTDTKILLVKPSLISEWDGSVAIGDWHNVYTPITNEYGYIWVIAETDTGATDIGVVKYETNGTITVTKASADIQWRVNGNDIQIANNINPGVGHWLKAHIRIDHEF